MACRIHYGAVVGWWGGGVVGWCGGGVVGWWGGGVVGWWGGGVVGWWGGWGGWGSGGGGAERVPVKMVLESVLIHQTNVSQRKDGHK